LSGLIPEARLPQPGENNPETTLGVNGAGDGGDDLNET
jgi:hypothetical protein